MTSPEDRFDLANVAGHQLAELGARVRRCAEGRDATFAEIADSIIDTLWSSLIERTPPIAALMRLYRVRATDELPAELQSRLTGRAAGPRVLELVATRGMEPAWNDVAASVAHRVLPLDSHDAPMVTKLTRDLGLAGHEDFASAQDVFYVADAVGDPSVPAQAEFVLRYNVRAVIGCGGLFRPDAGFALVVFSRVPLSAEVASGFGAIAVNAGLALVRATDLGGPPSALAEIRARALERVLQLHEFLLLKQLVDVSRELDTFRDQNARLSKTAATESEANAHRQTRTQRAMLNVIEDLREARRDLERRVAERTRELQRSNEDLRSSNAELEQFAYVASHDLQEPLRTISGYLQLLSERYGERLDADGHEFIDYAVRGAVRMQELIDALLVYSRVARGPLAGGIVALDGALDDAIQALARAIGDSRAEIVRGPLPTIRGDRVLLRQLFQNLLSNSIKFAGDTPPRIAIECEHTEGAVVVRVRDHGIGFDPKYAEQVFKVFRRLQRKLPGTGIGLAICRKIVERHGGTIQAHATPGEGATFEVTLPVNEHAS